MTYSPQVRQQISELVERFGYAACLACDRPLVKMFIDPSYDMMYVRCQGCSVFYPYLVFRERDGDA